MQLVNQFLMRCLDRWRRQAPRVQVSLFVSAAGLLVVLACWLSWQDSHSHEALFAGRQFDEREVTAIETAFGQAGLEDYYAENGTIFVPRRNRASFIKAIADRKALPMGFDEAYQEELTQTNLLESQAQYRARVQMAKERSLAQCLRGMPEIADASVHFDEVEIGGLHRQRSIRAMVVIQPADGAQLTSNSIQSIRALVASSKALLDPNEVTVTDLQSQISYTGNQEEIDRQFRADEYARQRLLSETEWYEKVRRALSFIPNVEVVTHIHFAPLDSERVSIDRHAQWNPKLINVSVGIPHSYYHRVRRTEGPAFPEATPDSATIQRIEIDTIGKVKEIVQGLLPPATDNFRSNVVVATFTDLGNESTTIPLLDFWMQRLRLNTTMLASILGLAVLALLFVRGIWKDLRTAPPSPNVDIPDSEHTLEHSQPLRAAVEPEEDSSLQSHESIHRELTRLVRDDPETAAEMLGEWVRKAG